MKITSLWDKLPQDIEFRIYGHVLAKRLSLSSHDKYMLMMLLDLAEDREFYSNGWAKKGECASNPGFALKMCAFSCGVCGEGDVCADTNATACAIWAVNDECSTSPEFMHRGCPAPRRRR